MSEEQGVEMMRIVFTERAGSACGREVVIHAGNAKDFLKHGLAKLPEDGSAETLPARLQRAVGNRPLDTSVDAHSEARRMLKDALRVIRKHRLYELFPVDWYSRAAALAGPPDADEGASTAGA
jgi:hypothetical protein